MKGTRPLDNDEIRSVSTCFTGTFQIRNRGLFMLGVSTGGRISELLSLTIGDVYQNGKSVTDLLFEKSIVKGGEVSRVVPVNADGRHAIETLIGWHREKYRGVASTRPLFPSRHKSGTVPLHRQTAHDILKNAFIAAGLNGKLATHSLRKSFAQRVYNKSGDIYLVQELLGHQNISTTQKYLGVNYADARAAVESIALITESDRNHQMSDSLKEIDSEKLLAEIKRRGLIFSAYENPLQVSPPYHALVSIPSDVSRACRRDLHIPTLNSKPITQYSQPLSHFFIVKQQKNRDFHLRKIRLNACCLTILICFNMFKGATNPRHD